jgi:hypothetical protein
MDISNIASNSIYPGNSMVDPEYAAAMEQAKLAEKAGVSVLKIVLAEEQEIAGAIINLLV